MPKPIPVLDRIARKTEYDPVTGCLCFTGSKDSGGYGQVGMGSRVDGTYRLVSVHRAAWLTLVGPIPGDRELDHFRCENRTCWNVTHLRPVTRRENALRGRTVSSANAAKTHCPCGEPYDWITSQGYRRHRACRQAWQKAYDAQRPPRRRS